MATVDDFKKCDIDIRGIDATEMEQRILDFVKENPGASFATMSQRIPDFDGDLGWEAGKPFINVIIWMGMSAQAMVATNNLIRSDRLVAKWTSPLNYYFDGRALKLPVAAEPDTYETLHWVPLVFFTPEQLQ